MVYGQLSNCVKEIFVLNKDILEEGDNRVIPLKM